MEEEEREEEETAATDQYYRSTTGQPPVYNGKTSVVQAVQGRYQTGSSKVSTKPVLPVSSSGTTGPETPAAPELPAELPPSRPA